MRSNQFGFSLIEVMVSAAILSVITLAAATFFSTQLKSNNFIEFQSQRDQLGNSLPGLFLKDPRNCGCLFKGAKFPANPSDSTLSGFTQPTAIGPFSDPSNCSSAIVNPLVGPGSANNLTLKNVTIDHINGSAAAGYYGILRITIDSPKEVLGPKTLNSAINVGLQGTVSGGQIALTGCSLEGSSGSGGIAAQGGTMFSTSCRRGESCDDQAKSLCQAFAGSTNYCLADIYSTYADGGDKNIGVKGYSCTPNLCSSGGNTQLRYSPTGQAEGL